MTPCQRSWNTGFDVHLVSESFKRKCIVANFTTIQALKATTANKVIDASPPPISHVLQLETAMEKLSLEDKQQLREFATTLGKSVRQHTARDKSKEDTGHLPYQISFCIQPREPGSTVTTASLLGEPNPEENNGPRNQ